mmetsp:Transcript_35383/g.75366  ORF Transcript_35383/g.75366 Transcript_35383/m.75366 type:complete len:189 (-) Transcript_35383:25-591(-)
MGQQASGLVSSSCCSKKIVEESLRDSSDHVVAPEDLASLLKGGVDTGKKRQAGLAAGSSSGSAAGAERPCEVPKLSPQVPDVAAKVAASRGPSSEALLSPTGEVCRQPKGLFEHACDSGGVVPLTSTGMRALSLALHDYALIWSDCIDAQPLCDAREGGMAPRKLVTRCWGPMTWADGVDDVLGKRSS